MGDDLKASFGTAFPKGIRLKAGETVVFSWIVYKSKAHRDRVNKKIMGDPKGSGCTFCHRRREHYSERIMEICTT